MKKTERGSKMIEVVAALLWEKGNDDISRFLICQRPPHKARGLFWEFVGGKVEQGETSENALVRECKEELDVRVKVLSLFMEVTHTYPDITVHLSIYHCEIAEGIPSMLEHNDMRWITPAEIPNYHFCPADAPIVEKIKELYQ